jgi:hypothetical protein
MPPPKPQHIILPPDGSRTVVYRDGGTRDIIRTIMAADRVSARYVCPEHLYQLKGATDVDTLRNVYRFVRSHVQYRADRPGHEVVRSPGYLFESGTGDCKSMSLAVGALCRAFGIPYRYRFVAQAGAPDFHHVYVVATTTDTGRDVPVDCVYHTFDAEAPYRRRLDLAPGARRGAGRLPALGGIGAGSMLVDCAWLPLLALSVWLLAGQPSIRFEKRSKKRSSK